MNASVEVKTLRELGSLLRELHLEMEVRHVDGYFRVAVRGMDTRLHHGSARELPDAVMAALECRERGYGAVAR